MKPAALSSLWAAFVRAPLRVRAGALGLRALRRAAQFGTFLWLLDAAFTLASGLPVTLVRSVGWVASLGLTIAVLVPILLALELLLGRSVASLRARASGVLRPREPVIEQERVAGACAWLLVAALILPLAFVLTRSAIIEIARPHFAALVVIALHITLALLGALLWSAASALCLAVIVRLAPTWLGAPLRSLRRWLASWLLLGSLLVVALIALFFETFRLLPWHVMGSLLGALVLTLGCELLAPRAPALLRRLFTVPLATVAAVALVAMALLGSAPDASRAASRESLGGEASYAALGFALDFDRDGYVSVLGGGDCAAFDNRRHPGAIDVPDNRFDEDCDGVDLKRSEMLKRPRHDWPVPSAFPKRPSVVLITVDALAARHLHVMGAKRPIAPELEKLAKAGTLFTSCFAQGPSTRLSFPSIFTSRWDSQIVQRLVGKHPFPIDNRETMLAEVLEDADYDTVAILSEAYFTARRWGSLLQGFSSVVDSPVRVGAGAKHNSVAVTNAAMEKLDRKSGKPLFLWAHYFDAHPPHSQPAGLPKYGTSATDRYDAEVQLVDREIGRLLRAIDKKLGKDTIVIVTGDHGIGFDSPRHRRFNYGYDLSSVVLHVPLIVRAPEVRVQQLDGLVSTMDITPTLTNLLRLRKPLPFEGASLVPELFEGRLQRAQWLHHQFYLHERLWDDKDPLETISLRSERFNLIHNRLTGSFELYDYRADYLETENLAEEPAFADVLKTMKQQLGLISYDLHAADRSATAAVPAPAKR
jgi:arylsulfatase A-like enzyme